MPVLPKGREGRRLLIKHRPVDFSRWPAYKTTRRYGLQPIIFASNPWGIIRDQLTKRVSATTKPEALAFIDQAEDYFRAASQTSTAATKPVLYYYSFLNLAKAFVLHRKVLPTIPKAKHGLSETLPDGGAELIDAYMDAYVNGANVNIFDAFHEALTGKHFTNSSKRIDVVNLLPQILQGHRIWCGIEGETERFISIENIRLLHDASKNSLWSALYFDAADLGRLCVSRRKMLEQSGLNPLFREVEHRNKRNAPKVLKFEQKTPVKYTGRPSDRIQKVVDLVRPSLWTNILSVPPYRKYYVYLCPTSSTSQLLPQLLSIYSLFYYLGSLTRYRPHKFYEVLSGDYSAQINEILLNIPSQFLYLIASEFAEQEVAHAAII